MKDESEPDTSRRSGSALIPPPSSLILSGEAMLVVMQSDASRAQIDRVIAVIQGQQLTPHELPGATRTAIGMTGNTGSVSAGLFEGLPGVDRAIRVTKPYKLASRR